MLVKTYKVSFLCIIIIIIMYFVMRITIEFDIYNEIMLFMFLQMNKGINLFAYMCAGFQ